jgi:hypothetical protein
VRAVLWEQGEADVFQSTPGAYKASLEKVILGSRALPSTRTLPWLVALDSWNPDISATGQFQSYGGLNVPPDIANGSSRLVTAGQLAVTTSAALQIAGEPAGTTKVSTGPNLNLLNGAYRRYRTAAASCNTVNPAWTNPCVVDAIHLTNVGTEGTNAYCWVDPKTGRATSPNDLGKGGPDFCDGLAASASQWTAILLPTLFGIAP